jgi:cysteine-rich repeat protein
MRYPAVQRVLYVSTVSVALLIAPATMLGQGASCGNGVREGLEQCDDGNTRNLDGCSSVCLFEQVQRINQLKQQFGALPATCVGNRFGSAFGSPLDTQLQTSIDDGVASGVTSNLFRISDLDDLSGTADAAVDVGVLASFPVSGPGYDGNSDRDWWYVVRPGWIDSGRLPKSHLSGSIVNHFLTTGPGKILFSLPLNGASPAVLSMSSVYITATNGPLAPPLVSAAGTPPGHVASEHLDPALTSYSNSAVAVDGEICGNISAASLNAVPFPSSLTTGLAKCTENFTNFNTWLDLLVRGCHVGLGGSVVVVAPKQPDTVDPEAPPAGAGGPYTLTLSGTTVSTCRDKNGATADKTTCLAAAAYSTFLKFSTDRVIAQACPDSPAASNDGPFCPGGTLHLYSTGLPAPAGSYDWTGPNGFASTDQNPVIANATGGAAGTYTVNVTVGSCTSAPSTTDVAVMNNNKPLVMSAPSSLGPNQIGAIASVPLTTGAVYAWTITDGTITAGGGTHQVTFNAAAGGDVQLSVVETKDICSNSGAVTIAIIPAAPHNLIATAVSSDVAATSIQLTWTPVAGVDHYEVHRLGSSGAVDFSVAIAAYTDLVEPPPQYPFPSGTEIKAFLYSVRAIGPPPASHASPYSNRDLASGTLFPPITAETTTIQAKHVMVLRAVLVGVRNLVPLVTVYGNPSLNAFPVMAVHIADLRANLDQALTFFVLPLPVYTYDVSAGTLIHAVDVTELQNAMK